MAIRKSLNQILQNMTPVGRGDSVYQVANADRINNLQDAIHLITQGEHIIAGNNVRKTSGQGYVMLTAEPKSRISGGGDEPFPWQISILEDPPGSGNFFAKVRPGTINNALPTNMFIAISVDATGTFYVVLDVNTDGAQVTNASWDIDPGPPDPFETGLNIAPDSFSVLLGVIVDLRVFQVVSKLLYAAPYVTIQSLRASPAPGEPYFDNNYSWQLMSY